MSPGSQGAHNFRWMDGFDAGVPGKVCRIEGYNLHDAMDHHDSRQTGVMNLYPANTMVAKKLTPYNVYVWAVG